jgi:hypothetical protein
MDRIQSFITVKQVVHRVTSGFKRLIRYIVDTELYSAAWFVRVDSSLCLDAVSDVKMLTLSIKVALILELRSLSNGSLSLGMQTVEAKCCILCRQFSRRDKEKRP